VEGLEGSSLGHEATTDEERNAIPHRESKEPKDELADGVSRSNVVSAFREMSIFRGLGD
jgi:hypothetical protein